MFATWEFTCTELTRLLHPLLSETHANLLPITLSTKAQVDKVRSKQSRSEWAIQDIVSLPISSDGGLRHANNLTGAESRIEVLI